MRYSSLFGYTIGIFAKELKISQANLRNYEKIGISIPKRNKGNRRIYTNKDYTKAKFILFLTRNLGLNTARVRIVLTIFNNFNIEIENSLPIIKEISEIAGFDENMQKQNIVRNKSKGRKPKPQCQIK